jgi:hypothetical protein
MEVLTAALNGAFVLVMTLVLTWYIRDRFNEQDKKIADLRAEMRDGVVAAIRLEFRDEIAGMRSDMINNALAVGAQARPDTA